MTDLTRDSERNLVPIWTLVDEFHQCSHLALYSGSTKDMATFYNFSIVMSGVVLMEKCCLIYYMTKTMVRKEVNIIRCKRPKKYKGLRTYLIKECVPVVLVCHGDILLEILCSNGLSILCSAFIMTFQTSSAFLSTIGVASQYSAIAASVATKISFYKQ